MTSKQLTMNYGSNYHNYGIIGRSEKIDEVITIIQTVAPTEISVLINGESGTGKEVFAHLVHNLSKRNKEKFVAINCGAIPEGLIENELFGHEKGSYTHASDMRKGYFETADRGTIFLDEIGELPLASQVKLLRVLENGTFMRVGGTKDIQIDVRVVAATNKNLEKMVEDGNFREDLYYRLKAINLQLPSLKDRLEDIPLFVFWFSSQAATKNNLPPLTYESEAIGEIINHRWKGNVRELKNFIEMLTVMEKGRRIDRISILKYLTDSQNKQNSNLPVPVLEPAPEKEREIIFRTLLEIKNDINQIKEFLLNQQTGKTTQNSDYYLNHDHTVDTINAAEEVLSNNFYTGTEKEEIEITLKKFNGNRKQAADVLNMSERTLYRKLNKYGLT